jgi:hypothetical protein
MNPMRNFLLGFLTLIMLTPSLACAMTYCPMQSANTGEQKPCHQSKDSKKDGPMLVLDCMSIDLFSQDIQTALPQPEDLSDTVHFAWADLTPDYSFQPANIHAIRAPPDWSATPPGQPSLILTTQRFRI